MKKQIPNILTTFRIVLVPVFLWVIFMSDITDKITVATLIFLVASITDYFDGMLARKMNVISDYGKIMDPLADKLLVISALLTMSLHMKLISIYVVIVIIIREVIVSYYREYFARRKIIIPANIWGKVKTFIQMITISAILIHSSLQEHLSSIGPIEGQNKIWLEIFFWIIAIITWYSGMEYFKNIIQLRRNR